MSGLFSEVVLASAARTTTQTGSAVLNPDSQGEFEAVEFVLNLTAFVTAASLTLSIEEFDEGSSAWVQVIAATALTATGQARLRYGPTIPASANASFTGIPGRQVRFVATHGNGNSHTYSIVMKRLMR